MNRRQVLEVLETAGQDLHTAYKIAEAAIALTLHATGPIDAQFMKIAESAIEGQSGIFKVIDSGLLVPKFRPDSINHDVTLLGPNASTSAEVEGTLGLLDIILGDQVDELKSVFEAQLNENEILKNLVPPDRSRGQKIIVVSNHLKLPDQGFTIGLFHVAARERGFDRLENFVTAIIGRAIGYFEFSGVNVIDGVLRNVGSVLKTFPSGNEGISTEEKILKVFKDRKNVETKKIYERIIHSHDGNILFMAASGQQDKIDPKTGLVNMAKIREGTVRMLIDAYRAGAIILPVFVDYGLDLGRDHSLVEFLEPMPAEKERDVHKIGRQIALVGSQKRQEATKIRPDIARFLTSIVYNQNN